MDVEYTSDHGIGVFFYRIVDVYLAKFVHGKASESTELHFRPHIRFLFFYRFVVVFLSKPQIKLKLLSDIKLE